MAQRRLTRDQIAKIVDNDPEAIRAFEDLFRQATQSGPADLTSVRLDVEGILQEPNVGREALDLALYIQDCMNNLGYAEIIKGTDQAASAINTATAITWSSITLARNISLGSPASRIVFARKGIYEFDISLSISSTSSSPKNIWLWYRLNGSDIADSSVIETNDTNNGYFNFSRTEFFEIAAGDYIEAMFAVSDLALSINAEPATAFAPAAPAAIATLRQLCPS